MADFQSNLPTQGQPSGNPQDGVNAIQGVAQQLGKMAQSIVNMVPAATTATSPTTSGKTLGTTATAIIASSAIRHGIIFHNPGTATVYVFPSAQTAPTLAAPAGAFVIYAGGTLPFPPTQFPNVNSSWSAFAATGTAQPITVVEFF